MVCENCIHYELCKEIEDGVVFCYTPQDKGCEHFIDKNNNVEVIRCKDCIHSRKPDKHADLCENVLHCGLWRGNEAKNVWHKYTKKYKDYSLVYDDEFCSDGEKTKEDKQ